MKYFTSIVHRWAYRTSLVLLILLGSTELQAQFDNTATGDVNLSDPGWVKVGEILEVLNNGTGTDRFEHWGKYDASGSLSDLVLAIIQESTNNVSFPSSNMHNYDFVTSLSNLTYTDGSIVPGRRVTLPATTAPLELSRIVFTYSGFVDGNRFIFNNTNLGNGGDPHSIPTPWIGAFGFHTDEEGDESGSVTNGTGAIPVHWKPGTTTATTPVDVSMIDQSADTNNDGQLTVLEWKNHMIALGFTNIHHIFVTTQSFGDFNTSFDPAATGINTTPLTDTDIIPAGDFDLYVTLLDTSDKAISSGYGAWVTGTVDMTMSVTDPRLETRLALYPNPTSDYFTVSRGSEQIDSSSITIYDMSGKIVARQTTDVSGLPKGIYILEIDTEGITFRKKMIIK